MMVKCYDCKCATDDWIAEPRVTGSNPTTYGEMYVCVNRRTCTENKKQSEARRRLYRNCVVCGQVVRYTAESKMEDLTDHLAAHGKHALVKAIMELWHCGDSCED